MRSRDAAIPFFLGIAMAILFHLSGRRSVEDVMTIVEEKRSLRNFAAQVQREVRLETRPVENSSAHAATLARAPCANCGNRAAKTKTPKEETRETRSQTGTEEAGSRQA